MITADPSFFSNTASLCERNGLSLAEKRLLAHLGDSKRTKVRKKQGCKVLVIMSDFDSDSLT